MLKKAVSEATINWNSRLIKIETAIKKEDKSQKKSESKSSTTSEVLDEVMNSEYISSHFIEEHSVLSYQSEHSLASDSEIATDHDFENLNDSDMYQSGKNYSSISHAQSDITMDSDSDTVDECQYHRIRSFKLFQRIIIFEIFCHR